MVLSGKNSRKAKIGQLKRLKHNLDTNCTTGIQEISIIINSSLVNIVILNCVSVAFYNFIQSKNWLGRGRSYQISMEDIVEVF